MKSVDLESMNAMINSMSGSMLRMKLDMIERALAESRPDDTLSDVMSDTGIDPAERAIILAGRLDGPAARKLALRIAGMVSDIIGGRTGRKVRTMLRSMSEALGDGDISGWRRKSLMGRALRIRRSLMRRSFATRDRDEDAAMTGALAVSDASASDLLAVHYAFDNVSGIVGAEKLLKEMRDWI